MTDLRYQQHYAVVLVEDQQETMRKDTEYQGSWMRRGGVGAFMMLARKWDRIEGLLGPHHLNIMSAIQADHDGPRQQGSDGTVIAEVRDLRRYLLNVEAYAIQQGWVEPPADHVAVFYREQYTLYKELAALCHEKGLEIVVEDGKMRLVQGLTPAQEAMARDRAAAAPGGPASAAPGSPLGTLPAAPEAAPATLAPAPVPEAAAASQRVADAGGPIVLAEDQEPAPVLPSQEERNPISATWAEWERLRNTTIHHGSLRGKTWGSVYHGVAGSDGRYDMLLDCQEEYGR